MEKKKRKWQKANMSTLNENMLLTIQEVAKLVRKADDTIRAAMDSWTQSGGRRGLRYVVMGKRRNVRYASIKEWLQREEEALACKRAAM